MRGNRFYFNFIPTRKSVHDVTQVQNSRVDDIKASPQGSGSPAGAAQQSPQDRAAARRAELRRLEQERRRREAVSKFKNSSGGPGYYIF